MDKDRIVGSANGIGDKLEGAVSDATGDAKTEASGHVREAAGTAQDLYGQAKDAARTVTDAAIESTKDAYENSETLRAGSDAVAQKVQQSPLGSLFIAGCIGFALALLMTRPPRRPSSRLRDYR
jgi:uncharacterized protein YjbJ (UPF0337 family)